LLALGLAVGLARPACATIVAAESAYADIARQVAGPGTPVVAILKNPATDPHLFEPSPSVARQVSEAAIVIENGIGYDGWMARLIAATHTPGQIRIVVANLLQRHDGDNPHLWYDPGAMPALVGMVSRALLAATPAQHAALNANRDRTLKSLAALQSRIDRLRQKFAGAQIAATEPVFGPMLAALGLKDRHGRFELSVMNGTEPRAGDTAAIEDDLRAHRIRALITNAQATDSEAMRLAGLARAQNIPLVPVTDTLPPGKTYQDWVGDELSALEAALAPAVTQ
jgi:zinc/manganese transport system substrate-binding protein